MIPGADLIQEARAEGVGVHVTPSSVYCRECGKEQMVVGYAGTAPDELKCGHIYIDRALRRCVRCGWPVNVGTCGPMGGYCGDGSHGCRVKP